MPTSGTPQVYEMGGMVGSGSFACLECGFPIALTASDSLPDCPSCGSPRFRRASLFEQPTVDAALVDPDDDDPAWLGELRDELPRGSRLLAFKDGGSVRRFAIAEGWMRIGRSATADLRLNDPTVSRRHALIVATREHELRVLDDRSLNGVFVNGEQIEWSPLHDGDELAIGRFRLHAIDLSNDRVSA
jgi:hypothetical protein